MLKSQKIEYVKALKKEIATYKTVAIMPTETVPDRLLQKVRNQLTQDSKVIIARKTLIVKALGSGDLEQLCKHMGSNFALILTNKEPFELYKIINANKLKLGAKPNQISPVDIVIESGDTSVAPGQTVTELKSAGIDVQIQKGKVVISKRKVLVEKGKKISGAVANALKILDIRPFEVAPGLRAAFAAGLLYNEAALRIDESVVTTELIKAFNAANAICMELGMVTEYNIKTLVSRAYLAAIAVGIEAKVSDPEITKMLPADVPAQPSEPAADAGVDTK